MDEDIKEKQVFSVHVEKLTCESNVSMKNYFGIMKQEMYYGKTLLSYREHKQKI